MKEIQKYLINNLEYTISGDSSEYAPIDIICIDYEKIKKYECKIEINLYKMLNNSQILFEFLKDCFNENKNHFTIVKTSDAILLYAAIDIKYRSECYNYVLKEKDMTNEDRMEIKIELMKKEMDKLNKKVIDQEKLIDELNQQIIKNEELKKEIKIEKKMDESSINVASVANGGRAIAYIEKGPSIDVSDLLINGGSNNGASVYWFSQQKEACYIQIEFKYKTPIDRVIVHMSLGDVFSVESSDTLFDFQVQGWNDEEEKWVNFGEKVNLTHKVLARIISFDRFETGQIRLYMTDCLGKRCNIVKVEAWTST